MEFPTLVYRCPGNHQRPGGTYAYLQVGNEDQFFSALGDGWFATLPEAIDGKPASRPSPLQQDDDTPPTRAELEQKATELQIKFDGRTSDRKLRDLIAATLEE